MSTTDIIILVVAGIGIIAIIGLGRAGPRTTDEINREVRREEDDDA